MQDRLRAAFSQTLSETIEEEGKRLTTEIGQAASRAVAELPQLRAGLSANAGALARASRAMEAAARENAELRTDNVNLERRGIEDAEQAAATLRVNAANSATAARKIAAAEKRANELKQVRA